MGGQPKSKCGRKGLARKAHGKSFIGVTKNNKNKWQTRLLIDGFQRSLATVDNAEHAARLHDILAIQTRGLKANTNWDYTAWQLLQILSMKNLMYARNECI